MKFKWLYVLASAAVFACTPTNVPTNVTPCDVVIKGIIKNPYSVSTLTAQHPNEKIAKTHTYEKFTIHNIGEYNYLKKNGVFLSPQPFDVADENFVAEKQGNASVFYGVVPGNVDISSLQHQHMDDLYMPTSNANDRTTATGSFNGHIKFFNPISSTYSNMEGVHVIMRDATKTVSGYTDVNGNFTISNAGIKSDTVQVLLEFDNDYCEIRTLDFGNLQGIVLTNRFSLGYKKSCGLANLQVEVGPTYNNFLLQHSMATLLALNQYRKFAADNGLLMPAKKMVFWLARDAKISDSYSTPMLNNISVTDPTEIKGLITHLFGATPADADNLYNLIGNKLPDVYAPFYASNYNKVPRGFIETLFHEFTHASHYAKVGNAFWNTYIQYIYANTGYGNDSLPNSGMIELSEAWAEDVSNFCAYQIYGQQGYITETERYTGSFIPYGIYNDIYDNAVDTATVRGNKRIFDHVSGISFTQMYQLLTPDIQTPLQYRDALKTTYPSQAVEIDSLYSVYGFH